MSKIKLASVIDDILSEIEASDDVKKSQEDIIKLASLSTTNTSPNISSNLGKLLVKVAETLRTSNLELTYEDIAKAIKNEK